MIDTRILTNNVVIALKIFFYTIVTLYYTGSYWLCFSMLFFRVNNFSDIDSYFLQSQISLPFGEKLL